MGKAGAEASDKAIARRCVGSYDLAFVQARGAMGSG